MLIDGLFEYRDNLSLGIRFILEVSERRPLACIKLTIG